MDRAGRFLRRRRDRFDPIRAGARYGLSPAQALAIWSRVAEDAAQFHAHAARMATPVAAGGRVPGRRTRVDADGIDERTSRVPGRQTLVAAEARRWASWDGVRGEPSVDAPAALLGAAEAARVTASLRPGGASFASRDLDGTAPDERAFGDLEPALVDPGNGGEPLPPAIVARGRRCRPPTPRPPRQRPWRSSAPPTMLPRPRTPRSPSCGKLA